ncbi:unnamed protein product [Phyllotreta striolata]|uniref:Uncharacterized protein n=1 Tax=Phyllotreta striolata TaxID=444603 RepID=A0A9N9TM47_PHYSR|nr:unnamed protein product [Phyllotreta striolata]
MCFLLTVTLMTYCLKKASTGSCVMEISILTFLVTLPLIVMTFAMYLITPYFIDEIEDRQFGLIRDCDKTRVIGLIERVYPDAQQFKLKCNGLNFGENMGVLLTDCFDASEVIPEKYYIASKSNYWCENSIVHSIKGFKKITDTTDSITILEADPPLPEPCTPDDEASLLRKDSYFYVEERFQSNAEHVLTGWKVRDRNSRIALQEIPVLSYCVPGFPSAIIFSRPGMYFSGFQKECRPHEPFDNVLVPYSKFLSQIHANFPHVEYRSNKVDLKKDDQTTAGVDTSRTGGVTLSEGATSVTVDGRTSNEATKLDSSRYLSTNEASSSTSEVPDLTKPKGSLIKLVIEEFCW